MLTFDRQNVSRGAVIETFEKYHDEIAYAATRANSDFKGGMMPGPRSAWGYTYLVLRRVDADDVEKYFGAMVDMIFTGTDDPRRAALARIRSAYDTGHRSSMAFRMEMISVLTRSWNAWRKGEPMQTIRMTSRQGIIPPVRPV
jgi:hypothetical protein